MVLVYVFSWLIFDHLPVSLRRPEMWILVDPSSSLVQETRLSVALPHLGQNFLAMSEVVAKQA